MPAQVATSPTFRYGKYKGESMYEIAETDPDYVVWVAENSISEKVPQQLYLDLVLKQQEEDPGDWDNDADMSDFSDLWEQW